MLYVVYLDDCSGLAVFICICSQTVVYDHSSTSLNAGLLFTKNL